MTDIEANKVPKFLRRLFREASDPENKQIHWSSDGERVVIEDKDRFVKCSLKRLSRTKDYSGFVRQLNMYGFVKMKSDRSNSAEEYYNGFFKQNKPKMLEQIMRMKKQEMGETRLNQSVLENSLAYLTTSNFRLSSEISELKERMERQECTINGLLEILGKVFRTGAQNINYESKIQKMRKDFTANLIGNHEKKEEGLFSKKEEEGKDVVVKEGDGRNRIVRDMDDIFF